VPTYKNTKEGQNPWKRDIIGTQKDIRDKVKKMGTVSKFFGIVTSYFRFVCTWLIFIPLHPSFLIGWIKILIRVHYYDLVSKLIKTNN